MPNHRSSVADPQKPPANSGTEVSQGISSASRLSCTKSLSNYKRRFMASDLIFLEQNFNKWEPWLLKGIVKNELVSNILHPDI